MGTLNLVATIEAINEQLKEIDKDIKRIVRSTLLAELLKTTPGIGDFSSLMILGEISNIDRFRTSRKLVSYAGLCPGIHQSGSKSHSVKNKACSKYLKWIMYYPRQLPCWIPVS